MSLDRTASSGSRKLFGAAGVLMLACCLAGPAVLGATAGAAVGSVFGIVAAVAVALAVALAVVGLLRLHRRGAAPGD